MPDLAKPPRRRRSSSGADARKLGFEYTKIGVSRFDLTDPYHAALTAGWPAFLLVGALLYSLTIGLFAGLYMLKADCLSNTHPGSIADRVFFSIETLATVGYGEIYPATFYGHMVSSAEIIVGMAVTAIMTGLLFVRFSRPRAKFVFSDHMVITRHNGRQTLMVRIGNGRASLLTKTTVQVNTLLNEEAPEGGRYRRIHELRLTRATIPMFPLITTFMHVIDETSPLAGLDLARIAQSDVRVMVSIEAYDPALGVVIQDLKTYDAGDIRHGWRFLDAVTVHEAGGVTADLTAISRSEPEGGPPSAGTEVLLA
jgi:inward rectifier potassium channel